MTDHILNQGSHSRVVSKYPDFVMTSKAQNYNMNAGWFGMILRPYQPHDGGIKIKKKQHEISYFRGITYIF